MSGKLGKSGRKKSIIPKGQHCATVDAEMYARIEEIANSHRWSIGSTVNYLVELGLDKYNGIYINT